MDTFSPTTAMTGSFLLLTLHVTGWATALLETHFIMNSTTLFYITNSGKDILLGY